MGSAENSPKIKKKLRRPTADGQVVHRGAHFLALSDVDGL